MQSQGSGDDAAQWVRDLIKLRKSARAPSERRESESSTSCATHEPRGPASEDEATSAELAGGDEESS